MLAVDRNALKAALETAVRTAETQPSTVPAMPAGWLSNSRLALVSDDGVAVEQSALVMIDGHSGYVAS